MNGAAPVTRSAQASAPDNCTPHVLREYALLADGERGALIGPRGDISWMCAPRWHDDAVFSALIGGPGIYEITPMDRFVWGGHYEDDAAQGGLIWRSRWITSRGVTECREALAVPARPDRLILLRRVIAVEAEARMRFRLTPAAGFGQLPLRELHREADGSWHGRVGQLYMRLYGATTARGDHLSPTLCGEFTVAPGTEHDFVLELSERPQTEPLVAANLWEVTEQTWLQTVPQFDECVAPRETRHGYAVLRGLTSASGGMVAAATTSLPERADTDRNYDYRYVWIRDQCYAGQAVAAGEAHALLDTAVSFVSQRLLDDGGRMRPVYTVDGTEVPAERQLDLPGYPGGSNVLGNPAGHQFQLDVFGEALLLFAAAARCDHLDATAYRAARIAADAIAENWQRPDAGIWELSPRRWAHSQLACVAGLRAAAVYAAPKEAAAWGSLADAVLAATGQYRHPTGRWQRAADDERVDAALLLPAVRGAVPADHPVTQRTIDAVATDLQRDGYIYRFRHDDRPLHEAEGAFTLCGFWMAMASHQQGELASATGYFERMRASCGPAGLYAEEFDVQQRQLRGNLPQAFVHALLVETAQRLAGNPGRNEIQRPA